MQACEWGPHLILTFDDGAQRGGVTGCWGTSPLAPGPILFHPLPDLPSLHTKGT